MKANNNPKNRRALLEYQKRQYELATSTEMEARNRIIQSNIEKWNDQVPQAMRFAVPKNLHTKTIEKIKKVPLRPPFTKNIVISAEEITNATFTAYAILSALIRSGVATPSQIKVTSILDGYTNISGMFNSRQWKEYFFDNDAKVFLIEGGSKYLTRLNSRGEDQFWRELIEFTRNNDKLVIITYATDESEREKDVFIPSLTGEPELNFRLVKRSVFVPLGKEEEEKVRYEQEKAYR